MGDIKILKIVNLLGVFKLKSAFLGVKSFFTQRNNWSKDQFCHLKL